VQSGQRGWGAGRGAVRGVPLPLGKGSGEGAGSPPQNIFLLFNLKTQHFVVVFKLDLTEETRAQLQEENAINNCLLLPHTGYAYAL